MSSRCRVLIVEDSPLQGTVLKRGLSARGYEANWARSGAEALEMLAQARPDVVVSDVQMPEMNGFELCRKIKADPGYASIPVILLTNLGGPQDILVGLNAGADNYVTKPYEEDYLVHRIESLVSPSPRPEGQAGNEQVLNLLISTFENSLEQNKVLRRVNLDLAAAEQELAERNRELEKLLEAKNALLGMAAHDLRNPLAVIMGYSKLLSSQHNSVESRRELVVDKIHASAQFMFRMVEDLLEVSSLDSGKLTLHYQTFDLRALVERCLELSRFLADAKNISLSLECPQLALSVRADDHKVEQVIVNLVSNAIKYSACKTKVVVRLSLERDWVKLAVADDGQGIPLEEQSQLFTPFGRTSVRSTGGEKSTGLGLFIVKRIVEGHGGRLELCSQPGVGSTFTVHLPREPQGREEPLSPRGS